jgi:hypothetical protein
MPIQDNEFYLAEDEAFGHGMGPKPLRFAIPVQADLDIGSGEWIPVEGGHVWRVVLASPNALTARVHLTGLRVPEGHEVRMSAPGWEGSTVGPIEGVGEFGTGEAWSMSLPTGEVLVEWFVPAGAKATELPFTGVEYYHGYRQIWKLDEQGEGGVAVGSCHLDPICFPTWANESNGTVALIFSGFLCSGQLTATTAADETPYVSTANHCISTSSQANSCQFNFFYRRNTCASGAGISYGTTVTGSDLMATQAASDCTLLMIRPTLPNGVYWVGWLGESVGTGTASTCLHHPGGSYQRISFGTKNANSFNCGSPTSNWSSLSWNPATQYGFTTIGVTEGGSSGSAIYRDSDKKLYGVLTCGASDCSAQQADDGYGRWDIAVNTGGFGALLAAGSDDPHEPNDYCGQFSNATLGASGNLSNLVVKRVDPDWFAFDVTPGQQLSLTASHSPSRGALRLELWDWYTGCVGGTLLATGTEGLAYTNTTHSTRLYLHVSLATNTRNIYGLNWSVTTPVPVNNICSTPTTIGLGATPFSTVGATSAGPALACLETGVTNIYNDVWFRFVPTASGTYTASTCGTSWGTEGAGLDTAIAIYGGGATCTALGTPIACNDNSSSCGGVVTAIGRNTNGQATVPTDLGAVKAIAAGGNHSVALRLDGTVRCWGLNTSQQCTVPTTIGVAKAIGAGGALSAALRTDGTFVGWGSNSHGQRVSLAGLTGATALSCGGYHNLAIRSDGTLAAWGRNDFGQGSVPAALSGAALSAVAAGAFHSVALKADGTVYSWGNSLFGQINTPAGATGVVRIAASFGHSLAAKSDGMVLAWGDNTHGQGQSASFSATPVSLAAGYYHSAAVQPDGSIACWGAFGDSNEGQCPSGIQPDLGSSGRVATGEAHTVFLSCNDFPTCETASSASWTATAGTSYLIRVGSPNIEKGVATLTLTFTPPPCPADIDGNGVVGADDISALLGAWGSSGSGSADTDLDNDGTVGSADLAILLGAWGACP